MSFIGAIVLICAGGSGERHGFELMMIPVFVICAALVVAFFAAITIAATFITDAAGSGAAGIVAWFALFFGTLFLNRLIADRSDRRKAARN